MPDDDLVPESAIDTTWRETSSCMWIGSSGGVNQPRDAVAYILRRAAPAIVAPWRERVADLEAALARVPSEIESALRQMADDTIARMMPVAEKSAVQAGLAVHAEWQKRWDQLVAEHDKALARVAELEAHTEQLAEICVELESDARLVAAEAQVARMQEAMALAPEAPQPWRDDTKAVWMSGWLAACRHVREAIHPSAPASAP